MLLISLPTAVRACSGRVTRVRHCVDPARRV